MKGFVARVHDPGPAENEMRGGHYVAYVRRQGVWLRHIQTWKLAHAFSVDSSGRMLLVFIVSPSLPSCPQSNGQIWSHALNCFIILLLVLLLPTRVPTGITHASCVAW